MNEILNKAEFKEILHLLFLIQYLHDVYLKENCR